MIRVIVEKNKYYFLKGNRQTEVTSDLLNKHNINPSNLFSMENLEELYKENDFFLAYNLSIAKLKNIKTESEIREILKKENFPITIINDVISKLINVGHINDKLYAKIFVTANISKKSFNNIKLDLKKKGISKTIIDNLALEEDESKYIKAHLLKIFKYSKENTASTKRKMLSSLARRGYAYDEITREIEKFFSKNKIDDELLIEKDIIKVSKKYAGKENKKELTKNALLRKGYSYDLIDRYLK